MKLKKIHEEMPIQVTPGELWTILSQYGDVSRFHAGVMKSYSEEGSGNQAQPGCERVCNIVDMGLHITLKERIMDYVEGVSYTYEVYEWKNFPLAKMLFGFTIHNHGETESVLAIDIQFKAKPAFLTPLMSGKMKKLARDVLFGYKHYAETGEKRIPIKKLKHMYQPQLKAEVNYV